MTLKPPGIFFFFFYSISLCWLLNARSDIFIDFWTLIPIIHLGVWLVFSKYLLNKFMLSTFVPNCDIWVILWFHLGWWCFLWQCNFPYSHVCLISHYSKEFSFFEFCSPPNYCPYHYLYIAKVQEDTTLYIFFFRKTKLSC